MDFYVRNALIVLSYIQITAYLLTVVIEKFGMAISWLDPTMGLVYKTVISLLQPNIHLVQK